jgi:hypothetical protein
MSELRDHVREMHHARVMRRSNADLARAHANEHWRYGMGLRHYHAGFTTGGMRRPPGWLDGSGVVAKDSAAAHLIA